jgi:hypothetical protein
MRFKLWLCYVCPFVFFKILIQIYKIINYISNSLSNKTNHNKIYYFYKNILDNKNGQHISKSHGWQQLKYEGSILDPTILNFIMWGIKLAQQIDFIEIMLVPHMLMLSRPPSQGAGQCIVVDMWFSDTSDSSHWMNCHDHHQWSCCAK